MMNFNDDKVKEILQSEDIPQKIQPENIKNMLDNTNAAKKRKQIKRSRIIRAVSAAAAFVLVFTAGAYYAMPLLQKNEIIEYSDTASQNEKYSYADDAGYLQMDVRPESIGSLSYAKSYDDVYDLYIKPRKPSALEKLQSYLFGDSYKYTNDVYYEDSLKGGVAEEDSMEMPETDDMESGSSINGGMGDGMGAGDATAGGAGGDYSETYNQEEGVFEADIVKTNGEQIFYSTGEKIVCSEVENGVFKSNTTIYPLNDMTDIHADWIEDMYLLGKQLVVIGTGYKITPEQADITFYYDKPVTFVALYDIETLELCHSYVQDGYYVDVRMPAMLYLVTNKTMYIDYYESEQKNYEEYIPSCIVDGEESLCNAEDILLPAECPENFYNLEYTIVSSINLLGNECKISVEDTQIISGGMCTVYCTEKNLYVASGYSETEITRFDITSNNIIPKAAGTVDGYVNDQFSFSEHNGYLRVATTIDGWTDNYDESAEWDISSNSYNNCLYVLDMDMNVVGSVDDFGIDETIRSVNFNGDMAYIVTFMQTDPLYAIDLSNPENPVILDEFKITGYSSYMQTWSNGLLVGFGAEADENGWETGVKLTMFDNSDPENLRALDTISVNANDGSNISIMSEGIGDRKALYIDPERNIIGFPLDVFDYDYLLENESYSENGVAIKCSYEFYSFENGEFQPLGHMYKNYYDEDVITEPFRRAVYIDGYLYALSGDMFISANAETFEQTDICEFEQRRYSELKY